MVMGYFNAKIGNQTEQNNVRKYGLENRNKIGGIVQSGK